MDVVRLPDIIDGLRAFAAKGPCHDVNMPKPVSNGVRLICVSNASNSRWTIFLDYHFSGVYLLLLVHLRNMLFSGGMR